MGGNGRVRSSAARQPDAHVRSDYLTRYVIQERTGPVWLDLLTDTDEKKARIQFESYKRLTITEVRLLEVKTNITERQLS